MRLYNVEKSLFSKYDTVIFDLDQTIWECFNPMGDGIPAFVLEPPFTLLDKNTIKDIRGNIAKLYPDVKDVLESLDRYGINLGIVSKSEADNVTEVAQPAYMLLGKFDLLKYFTYLVVIKRYIEKSDYVRPNGKTLFIDDDSEQIGDVNKRGLADVLNRHKFVGFKDLFTETKEVNDEPEFKMQQNAPQPTTSFWKSKLLAMAAKLKFPKELARRKYLDPNDILIDKTPSGLLHATSGVAFYYALDSGELYLGRGKTHPEMFEEMSLEDQETFGGKQDETGMYGNVWNGRCTNDGSLVVFWEPNTLAEVDQNDILADCLFKLVQQGILKKDATVGFEGDLKSNYVTVPELLHTEGSIKEGKNGQQESRNSENIQKQENQTSCEEASKEYEKTFLTFADLEIRYPTVQEIEEIHAEVVETWGGSNGYYDTTIAKLEAAIGRMQSSGFGQEFYPSIEEKAAILLHSLASSHPFVDGNKRTAYVTTLFFLEENGLTFEDISEDPGATHLADEILSISRGHEEGIVATGHEGVHTWLNHNVQPYVSELEGDDLDRPVASLKFSEDPLTYTDKSDIEDGNQKGRYEVFHQDDHFDIDNGRDHIWGEPWEPVNQVFLDPNIIPSLDDKRKVTDPNKGGIATSYLHTTATTFYQYADSLAEQGVFTYLTRYPNTTVSEMVERITPVIMQHLYKFMGDMYEDDVRYYVSNKIREFGETYTQLTTDFSDENEGIYPDYEYKGNYKTYNQEEYKQYIQEQEERRKVGIAEVTKLIPVFLLKKFLHEQFSISTLVNIVDKYIPNSHYLDFKEIKNIIKELPTTDPQNFHQNGNLIYIGDITQKPITEKIELNVDELRNVALSSIEDFSKYGDVVQETPDGIFIFKDNGSNVLGIAHLDTVQDLTHFDVSQQDDTRVIKNAQLDDRLGAYIILKLLPQLGVNCDILFTEGEEQGQSTARYFKPQKQYNWIFSFDRKGMDVVMYQYHDKSTEDRMNEEGFIPNKGSFSDISFLEHAGVKAFNFGTGYYGEHNKDAHAIESHILHNIKLFKQFYDKYKDTNMPHEDTGYIDRFTRHSSVDIEIEGESYRELPNDIATALSGSMAMFFGVKKHNNKMYVPIDRYDDLVEQTKEIIKEFSSLKFSVDLSHGEEYSDYTGTLDPSPKDPKHQDELEEPWSIRKDLERRYFETNQHNTVMRPETDRPTTPFASLKFADLVEEIVKPQEVVVISALDFHTDIHFHKPNSILRHQGVFDALKFEETNKYQFILRHENRDDYLYQPPKQG